MKRLISLKIVFALGWSSVFVYGLSHEAAQASSVSFVFAAEAELVGKGCDIGRDAQGIAHIRADQENVGVACLGYLHGRDRAWQIDFFRKVAQGRKSEVSGYEGIRSDFFLRLLGLRERAETLFSSMTARDQQILRNYSSGVNRGLREAIEAGVYEFKKLSYEPEPWSPEDSLALMLLQSFDQTRRGFQTQIDQENWKEKYPDEARDLFLPKGIPWFTPILKEGESSVRHAEKATPNTHSLENIQNSSFMSQSEHLSSLEKTSPSTLIPGVFGDTGMGSNNWVVAPGRSKSGNAWLANDPHLHTGYPSFWYWAHLDSGQVNTIGASFPGVPFIVSGANQHVSWGLTNSFLPVSRVSYVSENELKRAVVTRPWIWVRWWKFKFPFFFKTFRRTPSGLPVLPLPTPEGQAMVLRWSGFDLKPQDFVSTFALIRARSVREFDDTLAKIQVPSWNFVFADDRGGIGYRSVGRVPRFTQREMEFGIQPESLAQVENSSAFSHPWTAAEMPHVLNPKRGFIVTANNHHWKYEEHHGTKDFNVPVLNQGTAQILGFRAFRIEELLQKTPRHDLESLQKVQCDVQAVDARFIVPELVRVAGLESLSEGQKFALQVLNSWDYNADSKCRACALYRLTINEIFSELNLNNASLYRRLRQALNGTSSKDEEFKRVLLNSLDYALSQLNYEKTRDLPLWGSLHKNSFDHMGGAQLSPTHPVPTVGDDNTVNLGTSVWNKEFFEQTEGPSHRLIVEMSQPPRVYSVLAGSNLDIEKRVLEDPASEWQKWIRCEQQQRLFPINWSKSGMHLKRVVF